MPRSTRWRFRLKTLFVLVALVAIGLVLWKPMLIAYHDWAMRWVDAQSDAQSIAWSDLHCAALVRLGRYEKKQFYLNNFAVESPEARSLYRALRDIPVEDRILIMGPYGGAGPDHITVYAPGDHMHQFTGLIKSADEPPK